MIRFESITKKYGTTVAVDELDFVAPSGQITVLVGPSGCGKTTSLRMINRMIAPTSGRIYIDDRDTSKGSASKLRREIGYVIQAAGLFPHRTVLDNVATVPFLLGTKKATARSAALELLERVGVPAGRAGVGAGGGAAGRPPAFPPRGAGGGGAGGGGGARPAPPPAGVGGGGAV